MSFGLSARSDFPVRSFRDLSRAGISFTISFELSIHSTSKERLCSGAWGVRVTKKFSKI
jgi:hypothetical protein